MNLISVRLITDDVDRLVAFYARLTGAPVDRPTADFAELRTANGTLAIGSTRTVALFGPGSAEPAANRSAIVELITDDVDETYAEVDAWADVVQAPTTMPWGNRSLLLRDPDGTLVNVFAPRPRQHGRSSPTSAADAAVHPDPRASASRPFSGDGEGILGGRPALARPGFLVAPVRLDAR